jgi:RNA 2',3'-cyclic 3'-phosphodiesterase
VRAFIAVEVPRGETRAAGELVAAPEHLTLRFLGDIEARTAEAIMAALAPALAPFAPFEFVLEGVGAFPTPARPRVVWLGVSRGKGELESLARLVGETVRPIVGTSDSSPFVPHVTLFRVRSPRDRERAARLFEAGAPLPPPTRVLVTQVQFVESQLSSSGAHHRTLARFPLSGASR